MPTSSDVFIIVDVQVDFLPGGALAVADGDQIIPPINAISQYFAHVVATQDWHPPGHISFASNHSGAKTFETIALDYGKQVLWPDHCVQGSTGAALAAGLDTRKAQLIIRKGCSTAIDSYSAFVEADKKTPTGLTGYLRERGITRCFIAGLATDFCVAWTALDAVAAGFETMVIADACRAIDTQGSLAAAWKAMESAGVRRIESDAILARRHAL